MLLLLPMVLSANPTGGAVAAGTATIAGQGTSAVTIKQTSNIAIINWQTFSIGSGQSTSFLQPNANSAALNRVLGGGTSFINGTLSANGQVYLVNGNGVIVGPGGVINASAFTASTRDIADADFLSGNLHFTGSSDAGVKNLGSITALGGNVALIGRTVDNEGTIVAPNGTAGLIAANDVLLAQNNADGSTITVSPASVVANASTSKKIGVKNGGVITAAAAELKAANGNIYGLAVQNLGTIRATTVTHQGGHIWLTSDSGTVSNAGTLDASATVAGGKGGTVTIKSATGTASHTGRIIAQGGQGGIGGNAEISGAQVQFSGKVDLTAPKGTMGNLLIDPTDIDIVTGGGTDITAATIDPSAIVSALDSANVTLTASNSITVDNTVDASGNGNIGNLVLDAPILTLNAPIILNGTLSGTASTINVTAGGSIQNSVDAAGASATIELSNGALFGLTNEIVIDKTLDIEGNGANLNGENGTRVMEIDGGNVTLNNLVFQGGTAISNLGAAAGAENGNGGALLVYGFGTSPSVTITNDTFVGNLAINGGAIYNDGIGTGSSNIIIENSTFTENMGHFGSALYVIGESGGSAFIGLKADTIAENSGGMPGSGAIFTTVPTSGLATVRINDTIIAGNVDVNNAESDYVNGGGGTLMDNGFNLYGQNNDPGGFPGVVGGDVLQGGPIFTALGPLGIYGGFTPTLPLLEGSEALESGDPAFNGSVDQHGVTRGSPSDFSGNTSDIGAFEAQYVDAQANPVSVVYGDTPVFTYTITSGPATAMLIGEPALFTGAFDAGFYPGDIQQGSLQVSLPYILNFTAGDFTITPRSVTVLPDSGQGKVYGSADPILTYTASGLINGDTLTGSPGYEGQGEVMGVGTYQTNLGTIGDPTGNYAISLSAVAPTFAITPATLYYAADQVQVPAGASEFPNFTGTVVGFVGDDNLESSTEGSLIFTTPATLNSPTGYYAINGSGLSSNNYVFAQVATNSAALIIGNPQNGTLPANGMPTTPAQTQTAASTPNTQVSQAIAQSSTTSNTQPTTATVAGGNNTPLVQNAAPITVDMSVTSISDNESIVSTPVSSGGGDSQSASSAETAAVASGSSFSPDIGAQKVTPGQSVTIGGSAGVPPPPAAQAVLNQILGTGALDSLSTALSSATTAAASTTTTTDDSNSSSPSSSTTSSTPSSTASSTDSTPGQSGQSASAAAVAAAAAASPTAYANGPIIVGPSAMIAPGQTVSLGGGRASAGPPPASVQTAFDKGFSSESRQDLANAAGL